MPVTVKMDAKNINKFKNIILREGKKQEEVESPVEIIDLFATVYIENIAKALVKLFREMSIEVNVYIRDLTNDDINKCYKEANRYLFICCPQSFLQVYNCSTYPDHLHVLPENKYFLYQLEKLDIGSSVYLNENIISLVKKSRCTFDYSEVNLLYYPEQCKEKVIHLLPPVLEWDAVANEMDPYALYKKIDILFCGRNTDQRTNICQALRMEGYNVLHVTNVFGKELTNLIKKSKIFLNLHHDQSASLETCRLNEVVMSPDINIISEKSDQPELEKMYEDRVHFIERIVGDNYVELVDRVKELLDGKEIVKFNKEKWNKIIKLSLIKSSISNEIIIIIFNEDCMTYLSDCLSKDLLKYKINTFVCNTNKIKDYMYLIDRNNVYFLFTCIFKIHIELPKNKYIIYQLEQNINNNISHHYKNYKNYYNVFKNALYIFDYSIVNMNVLKKKNIECNYLPIPYKYEKYLENNENKLFDILFIGSINERRRRILNKLSEKYNVYTPITPIYGKELINLMNQCKILINIHFYENAILEIPRINEALNTNIYIVSEKDCIQGPDITELYSCLVTFIENIEDDYSELFNTVDSVLNEQNKKNYNNIQLLKNLEENYNKYIEKYFSKFIFEKTLIINSKDIAIVTANIGNYDVKYIDISNIKNKKYFDWYYFTDNNSIKSKDWSIMNDNVINKNIENYFNNKNMMIAKYYKVQPFHIEVLKKYKYIIWIDSSIQIINVNFVNDIIQKITSNQLDTEIFLFEHANRTNIMDEYILSSTLSKYKDCNMLNQITDYIDKDVNSNYKLYECGIIIYKSVSSIYSLCDDWWSEINKYGFQDQLSMPYVLNKNNINPILLNEDCFVRGVNNLEGSVWNNKLFGYVRDHL
jgi:hypothetical protein